MPEVEAPARPGTAQPYADVLQNVGKPSLSAGSDMPEIDLAKPAQGDGEAPANPSIDEPAAQPETEQTSDPKPEGEAPAEPTKSASEGGEVPGWVKGRLTAESNKRRAAEQKTAALEAQVAQLAEAVNKLTQADQPKEDPRPQRESFPDPAEYDKALEGWAGRRATEKATTDAKAELAKQQRESQFRALQDTHASREASFEADHPDYRDVVYTDDLKISPAMTQAILETEDGPAIAYYLGQNPDVAERIAGLTPARAVYEMGLISAKLSAPPPPKPAPIRPLSTRNTAEPKSPSEMSMEEYAEFRKSKSN